MIKHLLTGMEGMQIQVRKQRQSGDPQRTSVKRLSAAPLKAKCLERKSIATFRLKAKEEGKVEII
jgi:hypothetical protein